MCIYKTHHLASRAWQTVFVLVVVPEIMSLEKGKCTSSVPFAFCYYISLFLSLWSLFFYLFETIHYLASRAWQTVVSSVHQFVFPGRR